MSGTPPSAREPERMTTAHSPTALPEAIARFVRFPSPRLLVLQLAVLIPIRLWIGQFGVSDAWMVLGLALYWPVQEWALHAWLLHMRPFTVFGYRVDPMAARYHRKHHKQPWVLETCFLPPRAIITLIPVNLGLFWLIAPDWGAAITGAAAMGLAATIYEWLHYLTHTRVKPSGRFYRSVQRNHRLHHFRNERYWHSFTAPWIDRLFGTGPHPGSVKRSETCHTLGIEENDARAQREHLSGGASSS